MLAAILATLLFSVSVICANRTTRALGGTIANLSRLCLAAILLAIWAHSYGQGLGGGGLYWFFLSGVIGFGMGDLALYHALPRIGPRLTALLMQCLAAPFGALAEWLWLGTTLTLAQIGLGVVILLGVAVAIAPKEHLHLKRSVLVLGIVFGVIAALGQGLGAVLSRKAYFVVEGLGGEVDGLTATYQRIWGGLLFAIIPFCWVLRMNGTAWWTRWRSRPVGGGRLFSPAARKTGALVVLNALSGPRLGVACYQWALATTQRGEELPIVDTMPIVVMPFTYWIEGDVPTLRSVIGGLIAVGGVVGLTVC